MRTEKDLPATGMSCNTCIADPALWNKAQLQVRSHMVAL